MERFRLRLPSHFFERGENGGFGASLLLDLLGSQMLSVVPEVGFQVHPFILAAFHVLKGGVQHSRKDAWVLRRS